MNQYFMSASCVLPVPLAEIYTFASKERDEESGLSYFGARYYSSDLSIWLSVDPMSDKYPYQSNYVYCSNNPLKVIDPNGEDEWDIDEKGNLKKTKDNKDIDILHSTKTRQSMEFPVGTINEMSKDMGTVNYAVKNTTLSSGLISFIILANSMPSVPRI